MEAKARGGQTFHASALAAELADCRRQTLALLAADDRDRARAIRETLERDLAANESRSVLTVAFVGQYSAGKSTLISALTGRRDIRISADIATDRTTAYDWNGIQVIDTPGLFTDRPDHDAIAYDALKKADLLVFCLTHMLFDSLTIANFRKLAFDLGYRGKLLLVVNKLSDEGGDPDARIARYRESLDAALAPHSHTEFPCVFLDAKDYVEGVDEDDAYLVEASRFATFVEALNAFVASRGALGRMDTPARILLGALDDAEVFFAPDSAADATYLELLARVSRQVRLGRDRLRGATRAPALELSTRVIDEGARLARQLGVGKDFEGECKKSEENVTSAGARAVEALNATIAAASAELRSDIEGVLGGDLAASFTMRLGEQAEYRREDVAGNEALLRLREQVGQLKAIAETVGAGVGRLAQGTKIAGQSGQGFLSASQVAGSNLHQAVYAVGKFFNYAFAPWQAVNIAKSIANVALVAGPILGVFGAVVEGYTVLQEGRREEAIARGRREIAGHFVALGSEMEQQIDRTVRESAEPAIFDPVEQAVAAARQAESDAGARSNDQIAAVARIRGRLQSLVNAVSGAASAAAA